MLAAGRSGVDAGLVVFAGGRGAGVLAGAVFAGLAGTLGLGAGVARGADGVDAVAGDSAMFAFTSEGAGGAAAEIAPLAHI